MFDWISTGTDIPSNFKDIYEYPDVRFVQQNVLYLITTVLPVDDTTHVIGARCVARDLCTTAPWPLEPTCCGQFAA